MSKTMSRAFGCPQKYIQGPGEIANLPTLSAEYGRTMKLDYVVPQANALLDLVNDSLSPFTEKFTLRDLDIMSVNADGSLASSTGRVEDSKAAAAPPVFVDPYTARRARAAKRKKTIRRQR